jgi:hypothetical protein
LPPASRIIYWPSLSVDVRGNVTVPVSADANGFINGMTQTPLAERSGLFNFEGAFET